MIIVGLAKGREIPASPLPDERPPGVRKWTDGDPEKLTVEGSACEPSRYA